MDNRFFEELYDHLYFYEEDERKQIVDDYRVIFQDKLNEGISEEEIIKQFDTPEEISKMYAEEFNIEYSKTQKIISDSKSELKDVASEGKKFLGKVSTEFVTSSVKMGKIIKDSTFGVKAGETKTDSVNQKENQKEKTFEKVEESSEISSDLSKIDKDDKEVVDAQFEETPPKIIEGEFSDLTPDTLPIEENPIIYVLDNEKEEEEPESRNEKESISTSTNPLKQLMKWIFKVIHKIFRFIVLLFKIAAISFLSVLIVCTVTILVLFLLFFVPVQNYGAVMTIGVLNFLSILTIEVILISYLFRKRIGA